MYAVIKSGGNQFKVEPESVIRVEKIEGKKGDEVVFREVLAVEKMGELTIGKPYVKGAKVSGEIMVQDKGKKITVFRYKAKKRVRVRTGHRQPFTAVRIKEVVAGA